MIKQILRLALGNGGKHFGPLMRRIDSSLTIFCLHDVTDEPSQFTRENDIWVSTETFRKQMEFVASNFNVISMEQMLRGDLPTRAAVITFDDGFAGTFKNGITTLNQMGLPSTVFMNMSPVQGGNFWAERVFYLCGHVPSFMDFLGQNGVVDSPHPQMECTEELINKFHAEHGDGYQADFEHYLSPYATDEDLQEVDENPLVTLGSHLYTHYNVKTLSKDTLDQQYRENAEALSGFKRYLPVFAFPFGHPGICFSVDQAGYLLRTGALKLFTNWPRPNDDHTPGLLDRISLTPQHDRESQIWVQILKQPLQQMMGQTGSPMDYQLAEAGVGSDSEI